MKKLSLETLPEYDQGSLTVLVNDALRELYRDLDDRPLNKAARTLTIQIKLKPEDVETSTGPPSLESVASEIVVKHTLPDKAARVNILAASKKLGGLGFEPDTRRAKFDPDQEVMEFDDAEE